MERLAPLRGRQGDGRSLKGPDVRPQAGKPDHGVSVVTRRAWPIMGMAETGRGEARRSARAERTDLAAGAATPRRREDALDRHLREHDRLRDDLRVVEREIARDALVNPNIKRLMTIPGIDMVVAVGLLAAIGPIERFAGPDRLVAYLGLNPTVHQSGDGRPRHGRISKQGRTHARTMLVEAAWQAVRGPGPLRAFYQRVARRRGNPHCGRCGGAQTGCHHLASAQARRRLRLGPAGAPRQEASRSGAPLRASRRGAASAVQLTPTI